MLFYNDEMKCKINLGEFVIKIVIYKVIEEF